MAAWLYAPQGVEIAERERERERERENASVRESEREKAPNEQAQ